MCIKLIRHFQCSTTVEHVCEYLARCSNPTYMIEDLLGEDANGRRRRPCLDEGTLETREEWYEHACPDCTGENVAPSKEPTRVVNHAIPGRNDDYRYKYFNDPDIVPDDDAVSVYAQNLAYWFLARMYAPDEPFAIDGPPLPGPMGDERDTLVWDERRMCVLNELICQVDPEHGCLGKLTMGEDIFLETGRREFGFQLDYLGCPCLSTQNPWLCNWALDIRRQAAKKTYFQIADLGDSIDLRYAFNLQEHVIKECAKLGKAAAAKGPSAPEALPLLEVQHPLGNELGERNWVLGRDARLMTENFENHVLEQDYKTEDLEYGRHMSRASLLPWAVFILVHDSGLTLRRAREILALFGAKVVRHDPKWRDFKPRLFGYDACERLAAVASQRPGFVYYWVGETLGPLVTDLTVFSKKLEMKYRLWQHQDRDRVAQVRNNIVAATDAEFQELRESGDARCPICFEDFDDHDSALSKNPVQNQFCYERGNKHWMNAACLVKFARILYNLANQEAAPPPRCPMCRTDFEGLEGMESEPDED
jgi:hypothetical protein